LDADATCRWVHGLKAHDRTIMVYRGASHTLDFEREPTLQAYRADLLGWLRRQTAQVERQAERKREAEHDR
jgi:hypothetical protein